MDLEKLEAFVRVAQAGSLSAAARNLPLGPSGLSRQISALEAEFSGRLLHRNGRGVELTDLGARVLERAKALLDEAAALKDEVATAAGHYRGTVRIGIVPAMAGALMTHIVLETQRRYPGVILNVSMGLSGPVEKWVAEGTVDIGITMRVEPLDGEVPLTRSPIVLISKPGDHLTRTPTIALGKLDELPLIHSGAPSAFGRAIEALATRHGVRLRFVSEIDSPELTMRLVQAGAAYALVTELSIGEFLSERQIGVSRLVDPDLEAHFYLLTSSLKTASLASRDLSRFIRKLVQDFYKPPA